MGNFNSPENLIAAIVRILMIVSIVIGVARIIAGGYDIMMSQGNEQQLQQGKDTVTSAIMGILFGVAGVALLNIILKTLITA